MGINAFIDRALPSLADGVIYLLSTHPIMAGIYNPITTRYVAFVRRTVVLEGGTFGGFHGITIAIGSCLSNALPSVFTHSGTATSSTSPITYISNRLICGSS